MKINEVFIHLLCSVSYISRTVEFSNGFVLIHEAGPQSRPIVITIFARGVCTSVRLSSVRPSPLFKIAQNKNKFQVRIVIATGGTVGLAVWIIDDTSVL